MLICCVFVCLGCVLLFWVTENNEKVKWRRKEDRVWYSFLRGVEAGHFTENGLAPPEL